MTGLSKGGGGRAQFRSAATAVSFAIAAGCGLTTAADTHGPPMASHPSTSSLTPAVDTPHDSGTDPLGAPPKGNATSVDAGAGVLSAFTCPAVEDPHVACDSTSLWARDPASGNCCAYQTYCLLPSGWPRFQSASECETSCRCAEVSPLVPGDPESAALLVEHVSLDCYCNSDLGPCPKSLADAKATLCAPDALAARLNLGVTMTQGCGQVRLDVATGYGGPSWMFDAASGALLGGRVQGDTTFGPCGTVATLGGQDFSCTSASTCNLCGDPFLASEHSACD